MDFESFCASHGIKSATLDGAVHRFGEKKNDWYVGFQNFHAKSGEKIINLVGGSWKTGEKFEFKSTSKTKLSADDNKRIRVQIIEAIKLAEAERVADQEDVSKAAVEAYTTAAKSFGGHSYLKSKRLNGFYLNDIRSNLYEQGRALLIPCKDIDDKIWGVQKIFPDGTKRFMSGQKTSGTFFKIGEWTDIIYICEGFATGCSIVEAIFDTDQPYTVICAFSAGNLPVVAKLVRKKKPDAKIIICADKDESGVGESKGREAAKASSGIVVIPDLKSGSDFNDLLISDGKDAVKKQIFDAINKNEIENNGDGYAALGLNENTHYFLEKKNRTIYAVQSPTDTFLMNLMPLMYWETTFPGAKGGVNWLAAKNHVIQQSKSRGLYNRNLIRGTGVWLDQGKTIINLGRDVLGDTSKSRYIYIQTQNALPPIHKKPLSNDEAYNLVTACSSLRWTDEKSGVLLAGWLAIARVAGALPIRPHVWITGGAGTGKSTVMDGLVSPALGSEAGRYYLQGGTTEAGIRQIIKADSIPLVFDEFETTNEATRGRVDSIIELLRQSWSHTQGHIVKGSANGDAQQYTPNFAALVSSIRVGLTNDADRSRFAVLELDQHGSNADHWAQAQRAISQINTEYGERLFARAIKNINIILLNYDVFKKELGALINQRAGQQYGMLLAGWYSLVCDEIVTSEIAISAIKDLEFKTEKEEAKERDEKECLDQILTIKVQLLGELGNRVEKTISQIIDDAVPIEIDGLKNFGLVYKNGTLFVASNHAALKKTFFAGTRWENCWPKTLSRLPNAQKNALKKMGVQPIRGTLINL